MSDSYPDIGTFDVGERVRFRVTYRDPDTLTYVDPSSVTCLVWLEGEADSEDATVSRDAAGRYSGYFIPSFAGRHFVEMRSSGGYSVIVKGSFEAIGSVIPV